MLTLFEAFSKLVYAYGLVNDRTGASLVRANDVFLAFAHGYESIRAPRIPAIAGLAGAGLIRFAVMKYTPYIDTKRIRDP